MHGSQWSKEFKKQWGSKKHFQRVTSLFRPAIPAGYTHGGWGDALQWHVISGPSAAGQVPLWGAGQAVDSPVG